MNLKDENDIDFWNEFVWTSSNFMENEIFNIEGVTNITEIFEQEYSLPICDAEVDNIEENKEKESQCIATKECNKNVTVLHEETEEIVTPEYSQIELNLETIDEPIYVVVDKEICPVNNSEFSTCKLLKKCNSDSHLSVCHSLYNSKEVPESTSSKVFKANRSLPNILRNSRTRLSLDRMSPASCDTDDNAYNTSLTLDSSISEEENDRINRRVHRERKQIHSPFVVEEELVDLSVIDDSVETIATRRSIKKRKLHLRSRKRSQHLRKNVGGRERAASSSEVMDQRNSSLLTSTINPSQQFNILDPTLFPTSHQNDLIDLDDVINCLEHECFSTSLSQSQEDQTVSFDILSLNNWEKECEVSSTTIDNSANCQNYDINYNDTEAFDAMKYVELMKKELAQYAVVKEEENSCIKSEDLMEEMKEPRHLGFESQDYVYIENNDVRYININEYDFSTECSNKQQNQNDTLEEKTIVIPKEQCQINEENYSVVSNCEAETNVQIDDKTDRVGILGNSEDSLRLSQMDLDYIDLELFDSNSEINCELKSEYPQMESSANAVEAESKAIKKRSQKIERLQCLLCSLTFETKRSLALHLSGAHGDDYMILCERCGRLFNKMCLYKSHVTYCGRADVPFICDKCDRTYRHKCTLMQHLKNVHQIDFEQKYTKKYICNICSKMYKKIDAFMRHLDCHTND